MNKELISTAAAQRLIEVRDRVHRMDPLTFGDMSSFVTSSKEILLDQPDRISQLTRFSTPEEWGLADTDCLTSLRELALRGPGTLSGAPRPADDEFLRQLKTKTAARDSVFGLLTERYAWPLNFSLTAEEEIREYLLMRLMTADRTRIENESAAAVNADELLMKLNLISVHACTGTDLRFLDALNYYYELLPATPYPESQHAWLLVSWFALYARALNSWL